MFPGPGAVVYRNEAGEPLGWDYPSDEPYEPDPYEQARADSEWEDMHEDAWYYGVEAAEAGDECDPRWAEKNWFTRTAQEVASLQTTYAEAYTQTLEDIAERHGEE